MISSVSFFSHTIFFFLELDRRAQFEKEKDSMRKKETEEIIASSNLHDRCPGPLIEVVGVETRVE